MWLFDYSIICSIIAWLLKREVLFTFQFRGQVQINFLPRKFCEFLNVIVDAEKFPSQLKIHHFMPSRVKFSLDDYVLKFVSLAKLQQFENVKQFFVERTFFITNTFHVLNRKFRITKRAKR